MCALKVWRHLASSP